MDTKLHLELDDTLAAQIREVHAAVALRLPDQPLAETIAALLRSGLRVAGEPAPASVATTDDVPVGRLTAKEFARMFGLEDLAMARANGAKAQAASQEALAKMLEIVQHVNGLRVVNALITLRSPADIAGACNSWIQQFKDAPMPLHLVIASAWFDPSAQAPEAAYKPVSTPPPASGDKGAN